MSYLFNNYAPLDIYFKSGEGCFLFDNNNQQYLDAISGLGVVGLGHCHTEISNTICKQSQTLVHTSNLYRIENQEKLAKKLIRLTALEKVFFANSGAEANECAIKLTRLYAEKLNIKNPIILTTNDSFHGRTMATLSATGTNKIKSGFYPMLSEFEHINFNDIDAINSYKDNASVVAVMLEPILGEKGVVIPDNDYLNKVSEICKNNNWLFILDEVQTGIARTGAMFCYQHNNIKPDILTIAKGLGNGVPIGACIGGAKVARLFTPGSHGTTFGGNPLSSAVGLRVLNIIEQENIIDNVNKMSKYFLSQAQQILAPLTIIKNIRTKGLMIGISLDKYYPDLLNNALKLKFLISVNEKNIRLLPPLIINKKEVELLISKLYKLISAL